MISLRLVEFKRLIIARVTFIIILIDTTAQ